MWIIFLLGCDYIHLLDRDFFMPGIGICGVFWDEGLILWDEREQMSWA